MADIELNQWYSSGDVVLTYLALAGATCMIFDYITTLDIEIEVNRPKWKIPQGLFFLNRYVGIGWQIYTASFLLRNIGVASEERDTYVHIHLKNAGAGATYNLINALFGFVTFFAVHGIMICRVSSMYAHDRTILRILLTGFAVECTSYLVIQVPVWYYSRRLTDSDILIPNPVGFCGREKFPSWIFIAWIPLVLFECLICTLAVALGFRYYREAGSHGMFPNLPNSSRTSPLLFILLRDSIVFPFIFSLSCILNLVSYYLLSIGLRPATMHATFLLPAVLSGLLGPRLILNLRESYYEPYEQELNFRIETLTMPDSIELDGDIPMLCPNPTSTTLPTMVN
ncbi:hypothetical protein BDN70DRAFT_998992 [Pholiota conissans]|uniref:DUF6533 domain-containing protein n=1 Tax=Pholiota conissans TaxID=109636 RepID=A0A9P5YHZ5_9AGAR|nr:hypothetical protein BDN70DRAFT_998992 [Pholiota conissans]